MQIVCICLTLWCTPVASGPSVYIDDNAVISTAALLKTEADSAFQLSDYQKACEIYRQLLTVHATADGEQHHPDTRYLLTRITACYELIGQRHKAIPFYSRLTELFKDPSGHFHPDAAVVMISQAKAHVDVHQLSRAEELYRQAINILISAYGMDDLAVGHASYELGLVYRKDRKNHEAMASMYRALRVYKRQLPYNSQRRQQVVKLIEELSADM